MLIMFQNFPSCLNVEEDLKGEAVVVAADGQEEEVDEVMEEVAVEEVSLDLMKQADVVDSAIQVILKGETLVYGTPKTVGLGKAKRKTW